MTEPTQLPPAGWYPQRDGTGLRFWDGAAWTEQRAPQTLGPVPKPPRPRTNWASNLGLVAALLGGILVLTAYEMPALVAAIIAVFLGIAGVQWGKRYRDGHIAPGVVGIVIGGLLLLRVVGALLLYYALT
jgi:hypothetical protein